MNRYAKIRSPWRAPFSRLKCFVVKPTFSTHDSCFYNNILKINDFYHLSQEFNVNVLDLIKTKIFFPYVNLEKFKGLPSKAKFCNTLTNRTPGDKNYKYVHNIWEAFKMNTKNIIMIST